MTARPTEKKKAAADEADLAYQLLQNNPEMAKLIIAALSKKSAHGGLLEKMLESAVFQQTLKK